MGDRTRPTIAIVWLDPGRTQRRQGSYFPCWLLEWRRHAKAALVSAVATSYLLGVSRRRVEKLIQQRGVTSRPRSA